MPFMSGMSPESASLFMGLTVLTIAYVIVHWKYFLWDFPRDVAHLVDPRTQTLFPRTRWGFVVRALLVYGAYKAYRRFQEWWQQGREQRFQAVRRAEHVVGRAEATERFQTTAQAAGERVREAANAKEKSTTPAVVPATQPAPVPVDPLKERRDREAWLARLQAENDRAAAAKLEAQAARAAVAAAAASGAAAPPVESTDLSLTTTTVVAAGGEAAQPTTPPKATVAPHDAEATAEDVGTTPRPASSSGNSKGNVGAAGGSSAAERGGDGSSASSGVARSGSGANMVSLREAQEAEKRQQQLSISPSLTPLQQEANERNRQLREEQDAAYAASLEEDRRRAQEREAAEAAVAEEAAAAKPEEEAREAQAARFRELRQRLQQQLPPEPGREDDNSVLVRVRLPNGFCHTRRFKSDAPVQQVRDWLQSLEAFPLWEPERWSLVNSYPRQVLGGEEGPQSVAEVAKGDKQLALFVQEH